ncbi:MAG TPA: CDP-alcohol phosphatidyltransferase family protein, partial [Terriglobales bacterium]|nr:CDP-alcohol phosphatidyltransferase family protein [Terriglobales bacterium]
HVPSEYLAATEPVIAAGSGSVAGLAVETPETLSSAYVQKLLKADRPVVAKISPDKQALLERHLFDGSYKGITDLVTKWVWPAPARAVVRACVTLGIRPNAVTLTSLVLVLIVLGLFATGRFGSGLVLAWIMTFLDTVDGKLARVTIDSSALGHALDKGIDLIHPPLWYIAWGIGAFEAGRFGGSPGLLIDGSVVILAGYIGGRLLEGAFDFYLGKFPIYSWQPLDSYVRLIIARRNPNLLLLTAFLIAGSPGSGMLAVAAWTAISTVFLASRVGYAAYLRATSGPLQSWLRHPDHSAAAARTFSASNAGLTRALESGS